MLGTLRPVPRRPRPPRGPALTTAARLLAIAALGVVLSGCQTESGGTVEAAEDAPLADTTTTTTTRVPDPTGGSLRAEVPAPAEAPEAASEVFLFGDSVAVLLADDLALALDAPMVVDAVDCRRLDAGFDGPCGGVPAGTEVARGLDDLAPAAGHLDDPSRAAAVVVIANNAALRADHLDDAMAALPALPRVWWVTARVSGPAWQDPNNRLLAELAARDSRAGLIDWFAASEGQDWLADPVHPNDEGQAALAELVAAHIECDCTP